MRILIMGDFSGRSGQADATPRTEWSERKPIAVDIDNLERVMAGLAPRLQFSMNAIGGPDVVLEFRELNDFHPDALYQNLTLFQSLGQIRKRLLDPKTFAQTAAQLKHDAASPAPATDNDLTDSQKSILPENDSATLERILGRGPVPTTPTAAAEKAVTQWIRRVIAPYIVPSIEPRQQQFIRSIDTVISEWLRQILHHPDFQALESIWRGVYGLVSNLEVGESLKLYLLDITKEEITADMHAAHGRLDQSTLYRMLVDSTVKAAGGEPWSLWMGNYTFSHDSEDVTVLAALGALASQAGGPFIAAADCSLLGCHSPIDLPDPAVWKPESTEAEQYWQALRHSTLASWIGLALPRVLLRLPYGERTDPIESFGFEEIPLERDHERYLWGNPGFVCVQLLATAFLQEGWSMQPNQSLDLDDLPAYTYQEAGETVMQPCAEVFFGERAAQAILNRGIMPLLSYRNRNAVRLARFQSLADPPTMLSGPWNS